MAEFSAAELDRDGPRFWWSPAKRARWREAVDHRGRLGRVQRARDDAEEWTGAHGAFAAVALSVDDGDPLESEGTSYEGAHASAGTSAETGTSHSGSSDGPSSSGSSDGGSSGSSDGGSGGK